MRRDPIVIESYDPAWPEFFRTQRSKLECVIAPWLVRPVEHIGSTSILGLSSKPIIDMLAVVENYHAFSQSVDDLKTIGWAHAPEPHDEAQRKWSLCHPNIEHRTHHLHVVEGGIIRLARLDPVPRLPSLPPG